MSSTVTYKGPAEKGDGSTRYRVRREKGDDVVLPLGQPVEDVPADVVKQLKGVKGHNFDITSGKAAD